jgi:hypothetical protein
MTDHELVEAMAREGTPLSVIDSVVVETSMLDTDARDALWLYAWGCTERRVERR